MAMICELPELLERMRMKAFDTTSSQLLANSPPRHTVALSASLELPDSINWSKNGPADAHTDPTPKLKLRGSRISGSGIGNRTEHDSGATSLDKSADDDSNNVVGADLVGSEETPPQLVFVKVHVGPSIPSGDGAEPQAPVSLLSEAVTQARRTQVQITVHFSGKPFQIRCDRTDTIGKVIEKTLRLHSSNPSLHGESITAYQLRIAEDDGSPDEDSPPLENNENVGGFGKLFVLEKSGTPLVRQNSGALRYRSSTNELSPSSGSRIASSLSTTSIFLVWMPHDKESKSNTNLSSKMRFDANQGMDDLLKKLCLKRGFALDRYCFRHMGNDGALIDGNLKMGEIGAMEVKMVVKKRGFTRGKSVSRFPLIHKES
eukprot:TRINITY_DN2434_c0_g1_i1.p1 TRINITY_DN2434_c0_g1~~TRINITY_DN2434_c0_g1_i1.p1  ORF type:complete len:374 (+),score=91.28 TRINITY_DN2434_c0_g1_i1:489-1610(+)